MDPGRLTEVHLNDPIQCGSRIERQEDLWVRRKTIDDLLYFVAKQTSSHIPSSPHDCGARTLLSLAPGACGQHSTPILGRIANLIEALEDADDEICQSAALALGWIGREAKAAVPTLVRLLSRRSQIDKDPERFYGFRAVVTAALKGIGSASIPMLVELLKDSDPRCRLNALRALGYLAPVGKEIL